MLQREPSLSSLPLPRLVVNLRTRPHSPLDALHAGVYHVSYHAAALILLRRVLFRTPHGPAAERCAEL